MFPSLFHWTVSVLLEFIYGFIFMLWFFKTNTVILILNCLLAISYNSISLETITKGLVVFEEVIFLTFWCCGIFVLIFRYLSLSCCRHQYFNKIKTILLIIFSLIFMPYIFYHIHPLSQPLSGDCLSYPSSTMPSFISTLGERSAVCPSQMCGHSLEYGQVTRGHTIK